MAMTGVKLCSKKRVSNSKKLIIPSSSQIDNVKKANKIAKKFENLDWPKILGKFAKQVNPLLKTILKGMQYYWVIDQAEYSTDVMFKTPASLKPLYEKLEQHATLCFQAQDVMKYLGKNLFI